MSAKTETSPWTIDATEFPYGGDARCRFEFLLKYARLAPSSHNSQPWLFKFDGEALLLNADTSRALPVVDPDDRELIISCGCALEYLRIAARFFGHQLWIEYKQSNQHPELLARLLFGERHEGNETDSLLFQAIPNRHTNRHKFDERPVSDDVTQKLRLLAGRENVTCQFIRELKDRETIGRLISEADRLQASDRHFRNELSSWIHANRSFSNDGMPGYSLGMGDVASVFSPLIVRTFDWGSGQAAKDKQLALGSPLLMVLKTSGDSRSDWLSTGRALSRALLYLTDQGLSASFLNQPIEVKDLRVALKNELGDDGDPQILLRVGYGPPAKPTPRRPISEIML